MSANLGVGCHCTSCASPQWYDDGVCQGCGSDANIEFTWITRPKKGGGPSDAPSDILHLDSGVSDQLIDSWTNLILVRGLTPRITSDVDTDSPNVVAVAVGSPPWYRLRGVNCSIQFKKLPTNQNFADKLHHASDWTNQTFIVRLMVAFEEFASGNSPKHSRLPNFAGMREFHHARRLRNAIAHGNPLTSQTLVKEETELFRPGEAVARKCSLAINAVLEPLWARLLVYAKSLEQSSQALPVDPGVVVAVTDTIVAVQTFGGFRDINRDAHRFLSKPKIGDIISL